MQSIIDFETYSNTPIDQGSVKYTADPYLDIVCLAYKVDDYETLLWTPGDPVPKEFSVPNATYIAHNALFDFLVYQRCAVKKYNFPITGLDQWVDTQALANRYTFPGKLKDVGRILDLSVQKDPIGSRLIKKICVSKNGQRPRLGIDFTNDELIQLYDYCLQDVDSTYELVNTLPSNRLSKEEQRYWELTQLMNLTGLPVDVEFVNIVVDYLESYIEEMTLRVPTLTRGQVQKVTQVQKLTTYIKSRGLDIDNLQAATVDKLLDQDIPDDVRELLILRQALGRSSTAKYKKIRSLVHEGRVYNNLQYYGTSTGRWAGRGFQMHNLPRASVDDPEYYIDAFKKFKPIKDPVNVAKALIRPTITAPPGRMLICADYSSIENRLLAWVAEDERTLQGFRDGFDQYKDMASFLYGVSYDEVTKAQRQIGKIIILGCGYMMGYKRFKETADGWGVDLTLAECRNAVEAYRRKYHNVVQLWYGLRDAALAAVRSPGRSYEYHRCVFCVKKDHADNTWLVLNLPSGRNLFYFKPRLSHSGIGTTVAHEGINPYSKKWGKLHLSPGRITENVIQALARDIMAYGLVQVDDWMRQINLLGTVHDEAIGDLDELDATDEILDMFCKTLCTLPPWAKGLPLEAEGWIGKRYRK